VLLPGARNTFRGKLGRSRGELSYLPVDFLFCSIKHVANYVIFIQLQRRSNYNPKTLDDAVTGGAQQCQLGLSQYFPSQTKPNPPATK
jgi:hypothetical protein